MKIYMCVEFYEDGVLVHNGVATAEELATEFKDYRGAEHRITGFMTEDEVKDLTYTDRGMAHHDIPVDTSFVA